MGKMKGNVNLWPLINERLDDEGKSISRLSRELKGEGYDYHRLFVTGYLKALHDLRMVKEMSIPPAKVYLKRSDVPKNLFDLVGERARDLGGEGTGGAEMALIMLQNIFKRAIFQNELKRCGFDVMPEAEKVSGEERSDAKAVLNAQGVDVKPKEVALRTIKPLTKEMIAALNDALLESTRSRGFRKDSTQARLI